MTTVCHSSLLKFEIYCLYIREYILAQFGLPYSFYYGKLSSDSDPLWQVSGKLWLYGFGYYYG